jgi:hypothetical protein|tara:strand:- start:197 stop:430 length:234 start_codon:yes stop_codon:yes gene_type:complete
MVEEARPIIHIVNAATGEEITRPVNDEEWDEMKRLDALSAESRAAEEAIEAQRAADKASGDAKLKALGLTDDEIAAR